MPVTKDPLAEIAKILAKAENNPSAAEAEMAFERASKLSARYGIDLAVARSHLVGKEREQPTKEKVKVGDVRRRDNRYMMQLFTDIAMANDLRVMISGEYARKKVADGRYAHFYRYSREQLDEIRWAGLDPKNPDDKDEIDYLVGDPEQYVSKSQFKDSIYATLYGFPSDIEMTKKLYAVAVTMMTSQADRAIRRKEHGAASAKSWRANFYVGFTQRLNRRLWDIKREAEAEAMAELEGSEERSTALVLADKKAEVDDYYKEQNRQHFYRADGTEKKPRSWKGAQTQSTFWDARNAGSRAADRVNLGTNDNALPEGGRKAISG